MDNQAVFSGALNAQAAEDKIAQNEVSAASNIDFSISEGAALCRRGSRFYAYLGAASKVKNIYINHNRPYGLGNDPMYVAVGSTVYRGTAGSFSAIDVGSNNELVPFSFYGDKTLFANGAGTNYWADDGTNTTQWIKEAPGTAVSVSTITYTPSTFSGTWAINEGTAVATTTVLATVTNTDNQISLVFTPTSTNMSSIDGYSVGDWGTHYILFKCTVPVDVTKISIDYSIGDANFNNYYHAEFSSVNDTIADAGVAAESIIAASTSTDIPLGINERETILAELRSQLKVPQALISTVSGAPNILGIPRSSIVFVGQYTGNGWADIQAVRYIIKSNSAQEITIGNLSIRGSEGYPLTDINVGLRYWETWVAIDTYGNIVYESAPSPISTALLCQNAAVQIVSNDTPTGTGHGFTHRAFYRLGGYLNDAYLVGTCTLGTSTFIDRLNDISVVSNGVILERNVYDRANIPGNISCISEPHLDRLFCASGNTLYWTTPGDYTIIPKTNEATVSNSGDEIYSIVVWAPTVVIINRDSIYELNGSVFEGTSADWTLYRTGSKRGTKAPKVSIKTPYGIPLLDYDGIHMYIPGSGTDQPLQWAMDKLADAFKGEQTTDPATIKGARVPYINRGYLRDSFALWASNKLYLAVPTGSSTVPNTIFVLDFAKQRVWYYTYPFSMTCGAWEFLENRMYVGTPNGNIMEIEIGTVDYDESNIAQPIVYRVRTRRWTWPSDTIITNAIVDYQGSSILSYDVGVGLLPIGTNTSMTRSKNRLSHSGLVANYLVYDLTGTQATSGTGAFQGLYELTWDAKTQPELVRYWRTDVDIPGGEQEWKIAASELDCQASTVLGTLYLDASAVSTYTYTGSGPKGYAWPIAGTASAGLQNHPYARSAYMVYTSTGTFRHWNTWFEKVPEPSRTTHWRTETEVEDILTEYKALNCELDCLNATVLATIVVENTAIATATFSGSGYRTHTFSLPVLTFGKCAYVQYLSSGGANVFKPYKSWFTKDSSTTAVTSWREKAQVYEGEQEFRTVEGVSDCLGGTVLGTVFVDATSVSTFTLTGSGEQGWVRSLPAFTYGRSIYTIYNGTSVFKPIATWYHHTPEPSRVTIWRTPTQSHASEQQLLTWIAELDPITGTANPIIGTLFTQNVAIATRTFTYSWRDSKNIGLEYLGTGWPIVLAPNDQYYAIYTAASPFKHYETLFGVEPTPYYKTSWIATYRRPGGADQLDIGRYFSVDLEGPAGTATCIWEADGVVLTTATITHTGGRKFYDRLPMAAGSRGYLFRMRLYCPTECKLWASNLDISMIGIKGLVRRQHREGVIGSDN